MGSQRLKHKPWAFMGLHQVLCLYVSLCFCGSLYERHGRRKLALCLLLSLLPQIHPSIGPKAYFFEILSSTEDQLDIESQGPNYAKTTEQRGPFVAEQLQLDD